MRKLHNIYFFFLLMGMLSFAICIYLSPERSFSENENRNLAGRPEFTLESFLKGDYQKKMESYLKDQFPLRDEFMAEGSSIKKSLGMTLIGETYIGSHGRLFQKVTDDDITISRYEKNLDRLERLADHYPQIRSSIMLLPSAGIIYQEALPPYATLYNIEELEDILEQHWFHESVKTEDIRESMLAWIKKNPGDSLYYKTDHHWTSQGAYAGYLAWKKMREKGEVSWQEKDITEESFRCVTDSFYGSLYSRTLDREIQPDSIHIPENIPSVQIVADGRFIDLYQMDALKKKDKYEVFLGGNYGLVDIRGGQGQKTILLIKDSFANCFVPYLLQDYERIFMVDLRYYPGNVNNLLKEYDIKELLILYEISNFATDSNLARLSVR